MSLLALLGVITWGLFQLGEIENEPLVRARRVLTDVKGDAVTVLDGRPPVFVVTRDNTVIHDDGKRVLIGDSTFILPVGRLIFVTREGVAHPIQMPPGLGIPLHAPDSWAEWFDQPGYRNQLTRRGLEFESYWKD